MQGGAWVNLETAPLPVWAEGSFPLTFETIGDWLRVAIHGEPAITAEDDGVRVAGAVGVRILGQAVRASGITWQAVAEGDRKSARPAA